jgi:hypothetical protein
MTTGPGIVDRETDLTVVPRGSVKMMRRMRRMRRMRWLILALYSK